MTSVFITIFTFNNVYTKDNKLLNIYYSKTVSNCNNNIFNTLKENKGAKQVIFTPDRMTLQIEQKLFDALDEKCFFDIEVTTLTRFTNRIVINNNINTRVLTKPVCVALIKKILMENKDKFTTIKKAINYNGFASTLFDTISMFKSCNVPVDKINVDTKSSNLNQKLNDLKLVYECYENFLKNDYTDSFNKLDLLVNLIKGEDFSNTHFYFIGFDDFTPQMYNIISALIKKSASVNVACAVNFIDELNNKNIFLNNIYLNLLDLCTINGYKYNRVYCKDNYQSEFKIISNNLFAINPVRTDTQPNNIQLYKFNNPEDESLFVIKKIQELIINQNIGYNDINIVVPNIADYRPILERLFLSYNIPYFFDESQMITDSVLVRFYSDLFELINANFNKRELFNFLRYYSGLNSEVLNSFENMIIKTAINYSTILSRPHNFDITGLEEVYLVLDKLTAFKEDLKDCNSINDYCCRLEQFTEEFGFNNYLNNLSEEFKLHNNVLEYNRLNNIVNKVNKGFKELKDVLCDYVVDTKEAFAIIKAYFENISVTMPPILADSLFVTDINNYITKKTYTFMMGLEDGKVPMVQMDLGIITDQDIGLLTNNYRLSPTINMINKRSKFKVYENILNCEHIVMTYVSVSASGDKNMPSEVINNMCSIFSKVKVVNGSVLQHDYQNELINKDWFFFNNPNAKVAKTNFIKNLKTMQVDNSAVIKSNTANIYSALIDGGDNIESIFNNLNYINDVSNLNNDKLFLTTDKVSVSEIECYYSCPFKHFIDHGLKLKENDKSQFDSRVYGIILHEYVKLVVEYIVKNGDNGLTEFSLEVFDKILSSNNYQYLLYNPNNANDIKSLRKEILRINTALLRIHNVSSLKPEWLEKRCNGFEIGNDQVKIKLEGVIDRVDFDKDSFVVIDYKTGGSEFSDYTDIGSGKKLQLLVYVYIVSHLTGKQPIGSFYMPLKNDYSRDNQEELYKLKGVISSNFEDILKIDKSLNQADTKSYVVNVSRKGEKVNAKMAITPDDFNYLIEYTLNKVLDAVKNIKDGDIHPYPLKLNGKTTCEYCKYLGICKFSEDCGNKYNDQPTIKNIEGLKNNGSI